MLKTVQKSDNKDSSVDTLPQGPVTDVVLCPGGMNSSHGKDALMNFIEDSFD